MSPDDLVLSLQRLFDRAIRRARLGPAPERDRRRFLIVQIDGLSRSVLEQALADGFAPTLALLLRRGYRLTPMAAGMPTSTPAFQLAAMYGVRPDIPGFRYHDRPAGLDVYFPRRGDAARVERQGSEKGRGVLDGGSAYGCVFTGGAENSLLTFSMIKRPTGAGLLRAVAAWVVLLWVAVKGAALTGFELLRAAARFLADPVGEGRRGWKWLALKVGISVWLRQLFTLAVSRDLYAGVPAVWVNYLDYDVFAHAFGPRHPRALRALRRVDRSLHQLLRVVRRVPEHRYDVYILSDHGQAHCTPYQGLDGGRTIERLLLDELLPPGTVLPPDAEGHGLRAGVHAWRHHRAPGLIQRFVNYLERDFLWLLRERRRTDGVQVVAAGPNAFVYFLDQPTALGIDAIDQRAPGLVDELSRRRGIGLVLARSGAGPVCVWRGKRYHLMAGEDGPFRDRPDLPLVREGIRDLMAMPSAGDLVIYGHESPDGPVTYIPEVGAHAGPSRDELHVFLVTPPDVALAAPLTHPVQLHALLLAYQEGGREA